MRHGKREQAQTDRHARDEKRVELLRERLANLGWFMKALKEPPSSHGEQGRRVQRYFLGEPL
jgi:hypothetical protein